MIALRDRTLRPSSCTFNVLKNDGFVNQFNVFRREVDSVTISSEGDTIANEKTELVKKITIVITENTLPRNEQYPQVLCTNIVAGTVVLLNEAANDKLYGYEMKPIVKPEDDTRYSKESDLSILKIRNHRTYVVIECKLSVAQIITGDQKILNDLSQLFLEGIYVFEQEKESQRYDKLLLILTDALVWHFFTMDMSKKPLKVIKYCKIVGPEIAVHEVTQILVHNVKNEL